MRDGPGRGVLLEGEDGGGGGRPAGQTDGRGGGWTEVVGPVLTEH